MQVFIKRLSGETFVLDIDSYDLIDDIKKKINEREGIQVKCQALICGGRGLEGDKTAKYYNITDHSTLYLVARLLAG